MKYNFLIPAILFSSAVLANEQKHLSACEVEIREHCTDEASRKNSLACLLKHEKKVSDKCKQELQRLNKVVEAAGPRGSGGMSSFGGVMGGMGLMPPQKTVITMNGMLAPEGDPTVITQGKLNVATPVWRRNGEAFAMSMGGSRLAFNETQSFDNGVTTPSELHRIDLGGQYSRTLKNKAFLGMKASIGSASDKLFNTSDEVTFSFNSFYTKPETDNSQWIWTVFLSNNNSFANYIPIPGFIYLYKSEGFTGMFGLPFMSLQWTPVEPWIFSISYFITNFNSEIAYGFRDKLQTFAGFSISQQNYLRSDREEKKDRLFFNEKKVFVGMRSPLTKEVSGELQSGMSFDRKLKEGKSFNDTHMEADFGRSWYVSMNLNILI